MIILLGLYELSTLYCFQLGNTPDLYVGGREFRSQFVDQLSGFSQSFEGSAGVVP
jgi:hypothetical protein